jgi:hypothetical protein
MDRAASSVNAEMEWNLTLLHRSSMTPGDDTSAGAVILVDAHGIVTLHDAQPHN